MKMFITRSRNPSWLQPSGATHLSTPNVNVAATAYAGSSRESRLRRNRTGSPFASDAHAKYADMTTSPLAPISRGNENSGRPSSGCTNGPACVACCSRTENTATTRRTSQLIRRAEARGEFDTRGETRSGVFGNVGFDRYQA